MISDNSCIQCGKKLDSNCIKFSCKHSMCSTCLSQNLIDHEFENCTNSKIKIKCFCKEGTAEEEKNNILAVLSSSTTGEEKKEEILCKDHNKKVEKFCQICNKQMCEECASKDSIHVNSHITIEKVIKDQKKRLSSSLKLKTFEEMEKMLDSSEKSYQEELDKNTNAIKGKIEKIIDFFKKKIEFLEKKRETDLQVNKELFQIMKKSYFNFYTEVNKEDIPLKKLMMLNDMKKELKSISFKNKDSQNIDDFISNVLPQMVSDEITNLKLDFTEKINKSEVLSSVDTDHFEFTSTIFLKPNKNIITGGTDTSIKFLDYDKEKKTYTQSQITINQIGSSPRCICILKNENFMVGTFEGMIKMYEKDKYELIGTLSGHLKSVRKILQTGTEHIVSCSDDCTIKFWNFESFECIYSIDAHFGSINDMIIESNNNLVSCSEDKSIRIWNIDAKETIFDLKDAHDSGVYCLTKLHDGSIVSGGKDHFIKFWNSSSMECKNKFEAHSNWVSCLKEIMDKFLISGGRDNQIKIWNIYSLECIKIFSGHINTILDFYYFKDEEILVSGSCDSKVKVWKLSLDDY